MLSNLHSSPSNCCDVGLFRARKNSLFADIPTGSDPANEELILQPPNQVFPLHNIVEDGRIIFGGGVLQHSEETSSLELVALRLGANPSRKISCQGNQPSTDFCRVHKLSAMLGVNRIGLYNCERSRFNR